jgi:hypothetical protein
MKDPTTAANEAALWKSNFADPFMTLFDNNNISVTTWANVAWGTSVEEEVLTFFIHGAGNGITIQANGVPLDYALDTALSNWTDIQSSHLNR